MRTFLPIIASVLALALTPALAGAAYEVPITEGPDPGQVTVSDNPSVAWPANQSPPTEAALRGWFDALTQKLGARKGCQALSKFANYAMERASHGYTDDYDPAAWRTASDVAGSLYALLC
jgi:hypothetical protein